ncbi:MAG TPA: ParA family protein, partial [Acidovorax defluvii]|nr:ParA family protein [Acidovorax defluvii]
MDKRGNTAAQKTGSASFEAPENRLSGAETEAEKQPGKVIALLNQKGGAGKTTLATHLAGEFAMQGQHVTLLDADPQGSALDWAQRRAQSGHGRLYGV